MARQSGKGNRQPYTPEVAMGPDGLEELTRQLLAEIDRHRHVNAELTRFRVLARRAQLATAADHAAIVADLAAVVP